MQLTGGRRNAQEKRNGIEAARADHDGFESRFYDAHVLAKVGSEERAQYDAQGNIHHIVVNVALFAVFPRFGQFRGFFHGDVRVAGQAFAVKRGIAQTSLPAPEISVTGEQSVAKEFGIGARGHALNEVAGLAEQNLFDVLRMEEHVEVEVEKMVVDNVAVVARPAC